MLILTKSLKGLFLFYNNNQKPLNLIMGFPCFIETINNTNFYQDPFKESLGANRHPDRHL